MKLPTIPLSQGIFYALGAATTAGSIIGSYRGIESELGTSLALIGSAALGVTTYSALNVMFNHHGMGKRLAAALLSTVCICVSGETILLDAMNKTASSAQQHQSAEATAAKAEREKLLESDKAMKKDLRQQLNSLNAANATDRQDAATRQADVRSQISEIRRLNAIDETRIAGFQKDVNRGHKPQTNRANIRKARADIDKRTAKIPALDKQIQSIGDDLDKKIKHRDTQIASINARLTTQPVIAATLTKTPSSAVASDKSAPLGTRVRSYLYDAMTAIFLLLVFWYRPEEKPKATQSASELSTKPTAQSAPDNATSDTSRAHEEQFDAFAELLPDSAEPAAQYSDTSADISAQSSDLSRDIGEQTMLHRETKGEPDKSVEIQPLYDDATLLSMLENRQITPNSQGKISAKMIQDLSIRMNSPRTAKSFLDNAASMGVVDAVQDGKRGTSFAYPSVITRQSPLKLVTTGA